jgi:hypothetical protein
MLPVYRDTLCRGNHYSEALLINPTLSSVVLIPSERCLQHENRSVSHLVTFEAWDTTTSIQCIEHSVSKVVFENFGGHDCQWRLLHFLLGMARALKTIELYRLKGEDCDSTQVQLLFRSINRVYPGVQFLLFTASEPVNGLYLCQCCPGRCQNENRVSLL